MGEKHLIKIVKLLWRVSKMGEKHLIKIVKLLWRVSTKIMQQSEQQALNKFSQKGDIFLLYHAKLILVYLYSL